MTDNTAKQLIEKVMQISADTIDEQKEQIKELLEINEIYKNRVTELENFIRSTISPNLCMIELIASSTVTYTDEQVEKLTDIVEVVGKSKDKIMSKSIR